MVSLSTSPLARKHWPGLPERLAARLLSKTVKGKVCQILTSMADPLRFPSDEIVDLYSHRREERIYPRAIRLKPPKYPIKNKNASQLN